MTFLKILFWELVLWLALAFLYITKERQWRLTHRQKNKQASTPLTS